MSDILDVKAKMIVVRGQPVLIDRDVAALYGVETRALNQAVKRNPGRFPEGYIFTMTAEECSRSQIVTLNGGRGSNLKYLPHAFTGRGRPELVYDLDVKSLEGVRLWNSGWLGVVCQAVG